MAMPCGMVARHSAGHSLELFHISQNYFAVDLKIV